MARNQEETGTERRTERRTLADVDHTHPHTEEPFGETVYRRGPGVADDGGRESDEGSQSRGTPPRPDGGEREPTPAADGDAAGPEDEPEDEDRTMRDVSHTPPDGDGANRVFERGTEGRDESV